MENKHTMTDAELIKALKICGNVVDADCKECSYVGVIQNEHNNCKDKRI